MRIHIALTTHFNPGAFAGALREEILGYEPLADVRIRVIAAAPSRQFQTIETDAREDLRELLLGLIQNVRDAFSGQPLETPGPETEHPIDLAEMETAVSRGFKIVGRLVSGRVQLFAARS